MSINFLKYGNIEYLSQILYLAGLYVFISPLRSNQNQVNAVYRCKLDYYLQTNCQITLLQTNLYDLRCTSNAIINQKFDQPTKYYRQLGLTILLYLYIYQKHIALYSFIPVFSSTTQTMHNQSTLRCQHFVKIFIKMCINFSLLGSKDLALKFTKNQERKNLSY